MHKLFQDFDISNVPQQQGFELVDQFKGSPSGANNTRANCMGVDNMAVPTQLDYYSFDMHHDIEQTFVTGFDGTTFCNEDVLPQISTFLPSICPPPSAFLGPKCALWDCPRPAQGWNEDYQDYCSTFHGALAPMEGSPGMTPVLRPGGIGLKDSVLFSALKAKTEGKDVGVPVCEGAATARSPWNVPGMSLPLCILYVPPSCSRQGWVKYMLLVTIFVVFLSLSVTLISFSCDCRALRSNSS